MSKTTSPRRPAPADRAADPLGNILRQLSASRDVLVSRWARALADHGQGADGGRAAGVQTEAEAVEKRAAQV